MSSLRFALSTPANLLSKEEAPLNPAAMLKDTFDTTVATSVPESHNPTIRGRIEGHGASENEPEAASAKNKVVVVMGATGAGKSRLAIDLASHLAGVEIINADSMQVYRGLDVLTNKVPISERKGVPHHLLGNIDPSSEFSSRNFRNLAIPIIDDVLARGCLPVIVGGTNYYIQALVSPYLADDVVEDMTRGSENTMLGDIDLDSIDSYSAFELLKEIDPIAANKFHPNEHRKICRYLSLYASSGILPSKLFNGKAAEDRSGGALIISDMPVVLSGWMLRYLYLMNMLTAGLIV